MTPDGVGDTTKTILIVGASRGLGRGMAAAFLDQGWHVVGTVFEQGRTELHDLADAHPGRIVIEPLDMREPDQIAALRKRCDGRSLDILFVNAGTSNDWAETPATVATEEFVRVMVTNALSPMRVIEQLDELVTPDGTIGVMSSGQGSVANNETGSREVYRSSKAALNMFMRSYAARHAGGSRSLLVLAPGWVRTEMGGTDAPLGIEDSVPGLVDVILSHAGQPGLRYLDYRGQPVPW